MAPSAPGDSRTDKQMNSAPPRRRPTSSPSTTNRQRPQHAHPPPNPSRRHQERLLLSILPKHLAAEIRQDLGAVVTGQFKKIYMSRHENVR